MKIKYAAIALLIGGALCCSDSFGHDLLGRLVSRGGCGCDAAPTCCDSPAAACGGYTVSGNVHRHGLGLFRGLRGRGIGCGTYAEAGCGCDAPVYDSCCGRAGLLSRVRGLFHRDRGCGGNWGGCDHGCGGCDSGCSAAPVAVPVAANCGADFGHGHGCGGWDACGCGGRSGLLSGLRGRFGSRCGNDCGCGGFADNGCGCGSAAPVAAGCGADQGWHHGGSCGCGDACGCGHRHGLLSGFRGRFGSRLGNCGCGNAIGGDCGCGAAPVYAAPVTANCGCNGGSAAACCDDGCGWGGRRGGLFNRFRGHGGGYASDCGCGGGCGSGGYIGAGCGVDGGYAPTQPATAPAEIAPRESAPAGDGVVVPPTTSGKNQIKAPLVDPNAFIIRNTGYRN